MKLYLTLLLPFFFLSCKDSNPPKAVESNNGDSQYYSEAYRPQFHFSPSEKWMNDPNGLVYHKGTYHLFYQYYPEDIVWGPMHWGHAVSEDLIRWTHKPIALYPDELGYIFSGSAVVDHHNSSGFGTEENPPLVAIFTYHLMEGEQAGRNDFQTQGIAYSLDNGDSWTKYEGNPVIGNSNIRDFRDPKVFWHEQSERWILTLVAGDYAKFYASQNLKDWDLVSEFGREQGAHGGVWECPDLFKLPVAGSSEEKWVLLISINPGAPNGGSGTQYFVGDFDGTTFTTDQSGEKWLDHGRDNYAGVTYNNTPDGKRVFIGWMSNWDYARSTPTEVWRSAMTLPRELQLHKEGDQYFLTNYPIDALSSISSEVGTHDITSTNTNFILYRDDLHNSDITFEAKLSEKLDIHLGNDNDEWVQLAWDPESKVMQFDRTRSGQTDFKDNFASPVQKQSYDPQQRDVEVRLLIDQSSIEVFIDKGRYVFTNQVFPEQPYNFMDVETAPNVIIKRFKHHTLTSIWKGNE
ncbi:MAG: glycoside hydrolase family 32 protein [Bacteroidota bacterium]